MGQMADLVLWNPANFGARPEMVIKGGVIAWAHVSFISNSDIGEIIADILRSEMPMRQYLSFSPSLVDLCGHVNQQLRLSLRFFGLARLL